MENSKLGKLNGYDFLKGLVLTIIVAVLLAVKQTMEEGGQLDWTSIGSLSIITGIGYIVKQLGTNSNGKLSLKKEITSKQEK